jgi:hypothetical protein
MPYRQPVLQPEDPVVAKAAGKRPPRRFFRDEPERPQRERPLERLIATAAVPLPPGVAPEVEPAPAAGSAPLVAPPAILVAPPAIPTVQRKAFNPLTITFKK